jgi:hypothetical protein
MADVELVIKIPSEVYENIKNATADDNDISSLLLGIHEATPLPKGQGRLIERALNAAETLKQKTKTGHWIEKGHNFEKCWAECSVCGKTASGHSKDTGWGFTYSYTDYCPNCGARMESEAADL